MFSSFKRFLFTAGALILVVSLLGMPTLALAGTAVFDYATPIFGLARGPGGNLLVADAGAGIVMLNNGTGKLVVSLPGVADMSVIRGSQMYAVTGNGSPTPSMLFRGSIDDFGPFADLGAFEAAVNPDGGEIDSNPYDVESLADGSALIADAGGNSILVVDSQGNVDWVATLPYEFVSTANAKALVGCPEPSVPEAAFLCFLPEMIPAEAVPTSIAVGADGAYYVGELKGFPGPVGVSKIWRIEPGARHAVCGSSPQCRVVADGFTSIVDLSFGLDGTLYVTEFDENSFLAVELEAFFGVPGGMAGGTVNACNLSTWNCQVKASGLFMPIATAVDKKGQLYAAVNSLIPGAAAVIQLP